MPYYIEIENCTMCSWSDRNINKCYYNEGDYIDITDPLLIPDWCPGAKKGLVIPEGELEQYYAWREEQEHE